MSRFPTLKILAFAAHPDDVELAASGTLIKHINMGHACGIIDLTRGELGTRGSAELRDQEAEASSEIMGLTIRDNLNLGDGFFEENEATLLKVIAEIRKYQPQIVLANATSDRHPDHGRAASLISRACFLSGLPKIVCDFEGENLPAHRPKTVYHYIQDRNIGPNLIVDISAEYNQKKKAIMAFKSQFYDPNNQEPQTPISGQDFLSFLDARAQEFGRLIGCQYGEGFTTERCIGTNNLLDIL
ncbi:MAG: bacillithiol biosynthesis deacetylase BshB1 [Bacteroidia bacterium]|jgi:bacillithiol biosynthesis deacetylase BshB1